MKKIVFGSIGILSGLVGITFWLQWIHMLVGSYTALFSIIGVYFSDVPHGTWRLYLIMAVLLSGASISIYSMRYSVLLKILSIITLLSGIAGMLGILFWQYLGHNQILIALAVIGGELFIHTFFWTCLLSIILGVVLLVKTKG